MVELNLAFSVRLKNVRRDVLEDNVSEKIRQFILVEQLVVRIIDAADKVRMHQRINVHENIPMWTARSVIMASSIKHSVIPTENLTLRYAQVRVDEERIVMNDFGSAAANDQSRHNVPHQ